MLLIDRWKEGYIFPLTYFSLQSTDVYICICILCKHWHVYTGRSCFILDPFGFQGILNVNFIEALAEFCFSMVEVQKLQWNFYTFLRSACMYENCDAIVCFMKSCSYVLCIFAISPFIGTSGIPIPIPYFILLSFSETFSTETAEFKVRTFSFTIIISNMKQW